MAKQSFVDILVISDPVSIKKLICRHIFGLLDLTLNKKNGELPLKYPLIRKVITSLKLNN